MSRFLTRNSDGTYLEEIESMEVCKWKVNEICCNDSSPNLGDYPYLSFICENNKECKYFEKEDGIIDEQVKWKRNHRHD